MLAAIVGGDDVSVRLTETAIDGQLEAPVPDALSFKVVISAAGIIFTLYRLLAALPGAYSVALWTPSEATHWFSPYDRDLRRATANMPPPVPINPVPVNRAAAVFKPVIANSSCC